MLPFTVVYHFFLHGDFGPVKDGWFIHIIPEMDIFPSAFKELKPKLVFPPLTRFWFDKIDPGRLARPAPGFIITTGGLLHEEVTFLGFFVDSVSVCPLDVWINDNDELSIIIVRTPCFASSIFHGSFTYLSTLFIEYLFHLERFRELGMLPGKVLAVIRVLNIEPDHIVWHIMGIKLAIHVQNILLVNVVPSALVISEGKELR